MRTIKQPRPALGVQHHRRYLAHVLVSVPGKQLPYSVYPRSARLDGLPESDVQALAPEHQTMQAGFVFLDPAQLTSGHSSVKDGATSESYYRSIHPETGPGNTVPDRQTADRHLQKQMPSYLHFHCCIVSRLSHMQYATTAVEPPEDIPTLMPVVQAYMDRGTPPCAPYG